MCRIKTLIVFSLLSTWGWAAPAFPQVRGVEFFPQYRLMANSLVSGKATEPEYWAKRYRRNIDLENAITTDLSALFRQYLENKPLDYSSIKRQVSEDSFLFQNFEIASASAIHRESLSRIRQALPTLPLLRAIDLAKHSSQISPKHFRVYDSTTESEAPAYYERGTHKVKMTLSRVDPKNWLTWFVHEYLHYFDPKLAAAEVSADETVRLEKIAAAIRSGASLSEGPIEGQLEAYLSDLTDMSIQAEWRAWIGTTLFVQKALSSGLLQSPPPCLSFLIPEGLGVRELSVRELKDLWWKKLKAGFYVEETGLFSDARMRNKLIHFVESLDPQTMPIPDLLELVQ